MAKSVKNKNIEFKTTEEFLNSIKSNYKEIKIGDKVLLLPYYNDNTPGHSMPYYNNIIKNGGILETSTGELISIPSTVESHWLKLTITKKCINRGSDYVNWVYEFNKNKLDSGKITFNDIKKDYLIDEQGRVASRDIETGEITLDINYGHDGNGHIRIKGNNTSGTIESMVRQTFEREGLGDLVPNKLFSEYKFYIKSPNKLPEPKRLKPSGVIKFCGRYFLNDTGLLVALFNTPERKNKDGLSGIESVSLEEGKEIIEVYAKARPTIIENIEKEGTTLPEGPDFEYLKESYDTIKVALDEASSLYKEETGQNMGSFYKYYNNLVSSGSKYIPLAWNPDFNEPELRSENFYFILCTKHYYETSNYAPGFMLAIDKNQDLGVLIIIGKEHLYKFGYYYYKFKVSKIIDKNSKEYKNLVKEFFNLMLLQSYSFI